MEWKAGLDLVRRWLPAPLRAPLRGPDPGGRGCPGRGGAKRDRQLQVVWRVLRAAMAGTVVSYSISVPPGGPEPPIKSCEAVQPGLSSGSGQTGGRACAQG